MHSASIRRLDALRPAIKGEWETLLRQEPAVSALASPDMLVHLMDVTLSSLFAGLRRSGSRLLRHPDAHGSAPRPQACTLNPLLNYFATGELALHATAAAVIPEEIEELLLAFHALAQQEIEALCSVCQHQGQAGCLVNPLGRHREHAATHAHA